MLLAPAAPQGLEALAPGIAASASLRTLDLERKGITAAGCAALAGALASRDAREASGGGCGVEELVVGHNAIGGEGLQWLMAAFGSDRSEGNSNSGAGSQLRTLDAADCSLEGSAGVAALAVALQQGRLPSLSSLRLDGSKLGSQGVAELAPALGSAGCTLQQLHLQRCALGGEGVAALAAALPATLVTLDLSGNACGTGGAAALAQSLAADAAPHLRSLLLCGCGLDDAAVQALAAALPGRPPLSLDLSGNAVSDGALAALAAAPLSSLCLHDCKLGRTGAAALAEQLSARVAFTHLDDLDLSANEMEAPQLLALLHALTASAPAADGGDDGAAPFLRQLVIAANPGAASEEVSAAVERLQAARPGLDVVRRAADTGEGGVMG